MFLEFNLRGSIIFKNAFFTPFGPTHLRISYSLRQAFDQTITRNKKFFEVILVRVYFLTITQNQNFSDALTFEDHLGPPGGLS